MVDHYLHETITNWVADFIHGDAAGLFPPAVQEAGQPLLETLMTAACDQRGVQPAALTEEDLKAALLGAVARLSVGEEVRPFVPSLCRGFLADLQKQGRLGSGSTLGRYVGALKQAYLDASSDRPVTYQRPGEKIGRNDPCPCGSGKKYKKCCGSG